MPSSRHHLQGSTCFSRRTVSRPLHARSRLISRFLFLLFVVTGCGSYYVDTPPLEDYREYIYELEHTDQYVLVHFGGRTVHLKDVRVSEDPDLISGIIEVPDQTHESYKTSEKHKVHNYVPSVSNPLNEIHLFVGDDYWVEEGRFITRYDNIREVHKYFKEPNKTMRSKVFWVGVVVGVILILVYYFGSDEG